MKIEFRKVPYQERELELSQSGLTLKATFFKEDNHTVKVDGTLSGNITVSCIKSLCEFEKEVNEPIHILFSNRVYEGFDEEYDVIEVGLVVDFDAILEMEIASLQSDYNICPTCESKEINLEI